MRDGSATAAIADARALLDTLLASDWSEVHVVSGGTEIFVARAGGRVNPMRALQTIPAATVAPGKVKGAEVVAPHVATLVDTVETGTVVMSGQKVATIRVLDRTEDVQSPVAGTVTAVHVEAGDLLEFGSEILTLEAAA